LIRDRTRESALADLPVEIVVDDIRSFDTVERAFNGIDIVFHAAAKVSDWGEWKEFSEVTVDGTKNCVRASINNGVQRFLYVPQ